MKSILKDIILIPLMYFLENNSVTFSSPSFNIIGSRGETLFSANKEKIEFGTGEVRFTGII